MGALVLRAMLEIVQGDSLFPVIGRIVMVTPPNQGAEIADLFSRKSIFQFIMGPNLLNMRTDSSSLANHLLIPTNVEIGIIAGARFDKHGYNPLIKGDNDGYLSPAKTRLGTEKEYVEVSDSHSMIIHNKKVLKMIYNFLRMGRFSIQ
jgi:hypothetical protein